MGDVRRSRTAQAVAAERAVLHDSGVVDDPLARGMLTPSMAAVVWGVRRLPHRVAARSVTLAGLAARVLWVDAQVVAALDTGIDQVAIIGAGYDSRAWRFRRDGVRFFELDHAATQQDKVRRAPGPGPTYVEADLTTTNAAAALSEHGLDSTRPTLFVVEGVTMYLAEEDLRRQLDALAKVGATGSRLAVDFFPPPEAGTAQDNRLLRLQRLARIGSGESFRLQVDRSQAVGLVEASGWEVTEAMSLRDAARALVPRESGLPVEAINAHKLLVAGGCRGGA